MILAAPAALVAVVGGNHDIANLLAVLVTVFVATKLLGELAQRLGQPSVLGELVAGVLLGGSVLGVLDPSAPVIHAMAQIGVVILLFETGIHTDLGSLIRVGPVATTVAVAGVVLPLGMGYAAGVGFGLTPTQALVCGAALCATSVGISARVLGELGVLDTSEGRVVLGAAVIDDIIGLIILSMVAAIVGGQQVSAARLLGSAAVAIAFVVVAVALGRLMAPPALRVVQRARSGGMLGMFALSFAFLWAWLADVTGSAMIVGAFAAGVVLDDTPARREISRATTTLGHFFVPIFFAGVGAAVDLRALSDSRALGVGAALVVVGMIGKIAAGYAPFWFKGRKLLVGIAMMPRGEVGLIFAQMGLTSGAIDAGLFGAVMMMVMATTFVTPPALSFVTRGKRGVTLDRPREGGIDDLVAGVKDNQS